MCEIDVNSRLQELKYYEDISSNLTSKFNDLIKKYEFVTSHESPKLLTPVPSSTSTTIATETICSECCLPEQNVNRTSEPSRPSEHTICKQCLSTSSPNDYSSIWLLPRSEKLKVYEDAIGNGGHLTEPEMSIPFNDGPSKTSANHDDKRTFAEITKYKRDIKRKRMKHRTTKAPPLTHTEELRSLISLQMELWEQFCNDGKDSRKNVVKIQK